MIFKAGFAWLVSCCLMLVPVVDVSAQRNSRPPNIIFILADDLGYGELGCYGQSLIRTPHLDQMAAEGVRMTEFYSSSALCAPARCMWLTGLHSGHAPIRANMEMANGPDSFTDVLECGQVPLASGTPTVATFLRKVGYVTAVIGKWGLGMNDTPGNPLNHGFDYFFGYLDQKQAHNYFPTHLWENGERFPLSNPQIRVHSSIRPEQATDSTFASFIGTTYSIDELTKHSLAFIRENRSRPFFLYYAPTLPHLALQVPSSALKEYEGRFPEIPYLGNHGYCPSKSPRATYAAMVSYLDRQVGELLSELVKLGIDRNTIVVFTSDNGSAFKTGGADPEFFRVNGGLRDFKGSLYEGGIRVPFIVRWPGRIRPATIAGPAAGYDLFATFAEIAGSGKVAPPDGTSLLSLWYGKRERRSPRYYFELSEYGGQQAVRIGKWKAVRRNMISDELSPWELYDLSDDPGEAFDVSARFPRRLRRAIKFAAQQHIPVSVPEWNFMDVKGKSK